MGRPGRLVRRERRQGPRGRRSRCRLAIVVTGGAGAIEGALRLAARGGHEVAGVEIALRDLDDLPGNARRVAAAADHCGIEPERVHVELPHVPDSGSWLRAADEVAEAGLRLKFRTGGLEAAAFPAAHALARWIDAALDRETPFKCTAGLHHAVAPGGRRDRVRPPRLPQRAAGDGARLRRRPRSTRSPRCSASATPPSSCRAARDEDLARARRWFTSFGSCSVTEPLDDLLALGLLEKP